jgi:hypothetical protein
MFAKSIVFVVGAGASHELGFPLGDGLKQEISTDIRFRFDVFEQTSGSRELFALIRRKFGRDTNSYIEAGNLLSPAMEPFPSVDEALHHFAGNERVIELGKLAIAMRIIAHERASSLPAFQDYETKFSLPAGGWLAEFLSMALSGTTLRDNAHIFKNVTIVNLNYDRSPEHFLLQALQHNAARSEELAIAAIRGLKILRPYGSIGPLQWQTSELERIPYGGSGDLLQSTLGAATNIRTFTEQLVDDQIRKEIVAALNTAQAVIFLGELLPVSQTPS